MLMLTLAGFAGDPATRKGLSISKRKGLSISTTLIPYRPINAKISMEKLGGPRFFGLKNWMPSKCKAVGVIRLWLDRFYYVFLGICSGKEPSIMT